MSHHTPTVANCLLRATQFLPYHEAQLLTARTFGFDFERLTTREKEIVDEASFAKFKNALNRRRQGEPLAYVLEEQGFWSLNLRVRPDVLIPRADTETLVECVLPHVEATSTVLDLGTGSGNIGLAIAQETGCQVTLVDVSFDALDVAQHNANMLGIPAQFVQSDWFGSIPAVYDVVVSNPPYLPMNDRYLDEGDLRFEPPLALESGLDGLDALREIICNAPSFLHPGGLLAVEHGFDQMTDVTRLFERSGFSAIENFKDLNGVQRVVLGFKKNERR